MSRKTWGLVGLGTTLILALFWWAFRGKPLTPLEERTKIAFTRPTRLAPSSEEYSIFINGDDALKQIPSVPSNQKVSIAVFAPEDSTPDIFKKNLLLIIPRLSSQGPEGFEWMCTRCDLIVGLRNAPRPALGEGQAFKAHATFNLKPGEYVLRFYHQFGPFDAENGPDQTEFVGQGQLKVTASKSTEPSFVPLEDKRSMIPLMRPEDEESE